MENGPLIDEEYASIPDQPGLGIELDETTGREPSREENISIV
jgi:L-alanine-DL-glutamate epimerase-like enolase superfamily enzyme